MNVSTLKKSPFELGYQLSVMYDHDKNYQSLSKKTNIDRNQIRGLIRASKWSQRVKDFCEENNISISSMTNAALKAGVYDNDDKVIEYLTTKIKSRDTAKTRTTQIKEDTPVTSKVTPINDFTQELTNRDKEIEELNILNDVKEIEIEELKEDVKALQAQLESLKLDAQKTDFYPGKKEDKGEGLTFGKAFSNIVLSVIGAALTLFLIYQNYEFFSATDTSALINIRPISSLPTFSLSLNSLTVAIVVEVLLLLSAFFMYASRSKIERMTARLILVGLIVGIGVFMHSSIENKVYSTSDVVKNLNGEKTLLLDAIADDKETLKSYSKDFKAKRTELSKKIQADIDKVSAINKKLSSEKSIVSGNEASNIAYNTGIRVAAMILNVMLLHMLFFRRKEA